VEEKVGGSDVRDPTCICRERGDLCTEDTAYPGNDARISR